MAEFKFFFVTLHPVKARNLALAIKNAGALFVYIAQ